MSYGRRNSVAGVRFGGGGRSERDRQIRGGEVGEKKVAEGRKEERERNEGQVGVEGGGRGEWMSG